MIIFKMDRNNGIGQMVIGQNFSLPIALNPSALNPCFQLELVQQQDNSNQLEITAQQVQLQNILNEHVQSTVSNQST